MRDGYDGAMTSLRAVVFDVGNTLWFEAVAPDLDAIARVQAERLRPVVDGWTPEAARSLDGALVDVLKDIWTANMAAWDVERERGSLREIDVAFIARGALAARGIEINAAQSQEWLLAAWIPVRHFGVQLYPDVLDVLRELKELGLKVGVNTNRPCTAEMFAPDLEDFGLAPYVDAAVCSGDTGFQKPHRSTFELILERLAVGGSEAVMVGDSCAADMTGAKALGMRTVLKLNGHYGAPPCAHADFAIHDLAELLTLPLFGERGRHPVAAESLTPHDDGNEDRY